MSALVAEGKVPAIKGGRSGKKAEKAKFFKVGKRGSIIIPAEIVAEMGIEADAKFTIRKSKSGLALKSI
jgi:hypothetical protein